MAIAAVNAAKTDEELLIAIKRLGEVYYPKNPSTVKLALSLVMDPKRSIKARVGAAAVLGKFRDKSVVPLLNKYVIDPRVKKEVALSTAIVDVLGAIAHPSSILPLEKLSTYKEMPVAVASVKALGKIKDKRAVDELIKIFDVTEDPDDASSSRQKRYAQIAAAARSALISLTKESFPAARDYRKWWKEHKGEFTFEPPKAKPTPVPATKSR
jgi:HEAT repeat protein